MSTLYFLHGFLGDPDDWAPVISHLSGWNCVALPYPFSEPTDGILVGYSMGGRIAMKSPLPKILISAHLGLQREEERAARFKHDQSWIEMVKRKSVPEFLKAWYDQPLFDSLRRHPSFPHILQRRLQQDPLQWIQQMETHSLAFQPFHRPSQTMFLYGSLDQKYKGLYEKYRVPAKEIKGAGHACHLEDPEQVAQAIEEILKIIGY